MSDSRNPTIDDLLRVVPSRPEAVIADLRAWPHLAGAQDFSGYSLLHAAASYEQLELLRVLCNTYHVSPNIMDADGETPLFAAETTAAARCLVEDLGADFAIKNYEDMTAADSATANAKYDEAGQWEDVVVYLRKLNGETAAADNTLQAPSPLPPNVRMNVATMMQSEIEAEGAPDPEMRRRIEELAARSDFQDEETQGVLRSLVSEVVEGLAAEYNDREAKRKY